MRQLHVSDRGVIDRRWSALGEQKVKARPAILAWERSQFRPLLVKYRIGRTKPPRVETKMLRHSTLNMLSPTNYEQLPDNQLRAIAVTTTIT